MDGAIVEGVAHSGGGFGGFAQGREEVDRSPDFVFQSRGPAGRRRLRSRAPHPVQEPALPVGCRAVVGTARHPRESRRRRGGQLGAGPAAGRVVPLAGRLARRAAGPAARPGARPEPVCHRQGRRREQRRRRSLGLRRLASRLRRQRALGRDPDPDDERDGEPRFLAGRVRRRPVPVRSAPGAVLSREAPLLPRRHRAVRHAQQPDLHPPHRRAAGRGQAHRPGGAAHERRLPVGGGRSGHLGHRQPSPGVQHPARPARCRRGVEGGVRLHRSHRRHRGPTASPAPTRGWCGRTSTACCCKARPAAPTPRATRSWRRSGRPPSTAPGGATACAASCAGSTPTSSPIGLHQPRRHRPRQPHQPAHQLRSPGRVAGALHERRRHSTAPGSTTSSSPAAHRRIASCTSTRTWRCAAAGAWAARCWSSRSATTRASTRTTRVRIPRADGGLQFVPYTGARLPNLDYVLSFEVPTRKGLTADGLILWGKDENFYEWSSADIVFANIGATWRPTNQLRLEGALPAPVVPAPHRRQLRRHPAHPARKVEYQVTRAVFLRVVAEQNRNFVDTLRDDSRTNLPVYIRDASGCIGPRCARDQSRPTRLAVLLSAHAGHRRLRRLRQQPRGARPARRRPPDNTAAPPTGSSPRSVIFSACRLAASSTRPRGCGR